ncbi:phosphate ABC transporter permease PstA [Dolichospermum sp. LEGE 00240]|uniref:phosphate ABC transporter permease PstA n=1 Tax=Dolichospermum sp. LEGE 00240 TaxID=1828603 RepID=UPI0018825174|nr:phosphate ABC transporter permease PstA [Dolichospermum sp. LEGE 00240]MBE9251144.1 phosphate ABC transporter permease PstA [Dolichospermum sp. LEGE 00240]
MSAYQNSETDQAAAASLCQSLSTDRQIFTYLMTSIAFGLSGLALLPLLSILWEIMSRGASGFRLEMLFHPLIENGFANAILGTILMVSIGALLSIPVGVITGIFLAEFSQTNPFTQYVRFITSIITGVPSIIVGIFAYGVIVLLTKGFSAIAGGFALAVIMLPVIVLTTEEALKLIPVPQRLASAALGGTRFQTTFRVIVSSAIPGITTGISLAIARASGETAPLLFTALFSQNWSDGLLSPTASLPVLIFNLYNNPDPAVNELVWTTSIILLTLVLFFSLLSRVIAKKR